MDMGRRKSSYTTIAYKVILVCIYNAVHLCSWIVPSCHVIHRHNTIIMRGAVDGHYDEETLPDSELRLFWHGQSFSALERILDSVIIDQNPTSDPLLIRQDREEKSHLSSEELFSSLFEGSPNTLSDSEPFFPYSRKRSFRMDIAYRGSCFCGWQTQPNNQELPSVQQSLEEWLRPLSSSGRVDVRVSGRTDAGVSALGQVCRFRTNRVVSAQQVLQHMSTCPLVKEGSLRCLKVTRVTDQFHPTFGSKKRAYVYIMDPKSLSVENIQELNNMLQRLEGMELDYYGVSYGKVKTETTLCTLEFARASLVTVSGDNERMLCIQLVGDRFLRRMVRILVATVLREVLGTANSGNEDRLLDIVQARDRKASARAAPPGGLMFVGASVVE